MSALHFSGDALFFFLPASPESLSHVSRSILARLQRIVGKLPETHVVEAWGAQTFRVKNKLIAMYGGVDDHHDAGREGLWLKTTPANQELMLQFAPTRFYFPAYVGKSGWVGVYLDSVCDWEELEDLIRDAYLMTAPKRVAAKLSAPAETAEEKSPAKAVKKNLKKTVKKKVKKTVKKAVRKTVKKNVKKA